MSLAWQDVEAVADAVAATVDQQVRVIYRPRFNVAPTDPHAVVLGDGGVRRLEMARWGFVRPGRPVLINARSETAALRDSFRAAFATRRCVVPADGFYEWSGPKEARQPHFIHRGDGQLLLFAGLWEDDGAGAGRRFCVLTTVAKDTVARLHDRMPVILPPGDVAAWLAEGSPKLLEAASADALVAEPVSTRVNSVKHDDAACRAPHVPPAPRQLGLFP